MNQLFRQGLACIAGLFIFCISLPAQLPGQPSYPVREIEIRHVGPPAVSDSLIFANIRSKVGDPYNRPTVDDDVRNLYLTGFFRRIEVLETELPEGGVKLIYVVMGNPLLTDIRFEGNSKFSDSKLRREITSEVGKPLNERVLWDDARAITKLYEKKGYYGTEVDYLPSIDEQAGRAGVVFEITEVPKIRIEDVVFEGATAFSQKELRYTFKKTRRWWMFSWLTGNGRFKEDEFQRDKELLANFYRNEGYLDFEIRDVVFDYPEPDEMIIRVQVFEGKQYRVGSIGFEGVTLIDTNRFIDGIRMADGTRSGLEMLPGEVFTPNGLDQDRSFLLNAYGAQGYIKTRVFPRKQPNIETGDIDITYEVRESEKVYIEKVEIQGNTKTKDRVIRRELAVHPGEVFDKYLVKVSTNRLGGLNFFSRISDTDEETDLPNRHDLVISVEEKNTGNFQIGAGLSTIDSLVGFAELTQGNFDLFNPPYFTGAGQKLRLRVQMGTQRQDFEASFVEPWFFGRKLIYSQDLYHRDLDFQSAIYRERRTGASTSFTRALGWDWLRGTLSYTIEDVGILDVDQNASPIIKSEEGSRLVSKLGASIDFDRRGPGYLPNYGYRSQLLTEMAGGPLGADTDFYRLEFRHSHYFRGFDEGHVLEFLGRVGVVDSYGRSDRVPLFDRNFMGGAFNMRGFDYREVGPKDVTGEPIGGSTYWFGSVEYSVPVIDRMRFAVFYDIGMVYQDAYSFNSKVYDSNNNFIFDSGAYNDNFGFGIRLNLPIGPLVLDYGIPLTSDRFNDSTGQFQFRAGYNRDF